jgi:GNAT superfamily N-acetyltransferase
MQIRQAELSDRERILAFFAEAHSEPAPIRTIDRVLRFGCCLLAETAGDIVAYATLEYTFFERGFVSMLYVAEPHRRTGIARRLMEAAASRCTTHLLFTSTNQSNGPMRALLADLGYTPSGSVDHLDPHDPELFFVREVRGGAV